MINHEDYVFENRWIWHIIKYSDHTKGTERIKTVYDLIVASFFDKLPG